MSDYGHVSPLVGISSVRRLLNVSSEVSIPFPQIRYGKRAFVARAKIVEWLVSNDIAKDEAEAGQMIIRAEEWGDGPGIRKARKGPRKNLLDLLKEYEDKWAEMVVEAERILKQEALRKERSAKG